MSKKNSLSRRDFVRTSALVAAACAAPSDLFAAAAVTNEPPSADEAPPIRLGLASYTFRNFSRAQMIGFMKQLNVFALNAKDVKDHLPMAPQEEAPALADYAAAVIKLHAAGAMTVIMRDARPPKMTERTWVGWLMVRKAAMRAWASGAARRVP